MRDHTWVSSRKNRLSVMIHTPENFIQGTPVIVLCHGFTGNKIGANHLTKNLADFIEQLGYGVVRFDYIGSGDSDGEFATKTSVAGWRQDLESILVWVHEQEDFKKSPILLYGHSLGGLVVLTHPAGDIRIAARIVFAPVTQAVENFRDIILGQELWQQALQGESIENFYESAFTLNSQFVQDLVANSYNPAQNLTGTKQPLLFIHGTTDDVVPLAGTQVVYDAYDGQKELAITNFDHVAAKQHNELQRIIGKWLADQFPLT
jgi:alpha/beta superfamily hydrolase